MKNKITPQEYYSLQDIVRDEIFPWAKSFWLARRSIEQDRVTENILKGHITGEGRAKKYLFKGENIIKFIKKFESGKIKL